MNRRVVLLSAAAFLIGIALVHFYLERLEREISGGALVEVVVAARDLSLGEVLAEGDIALRRVPEAFVDGRRIRAFEVPESLGLPLATAVSEGEAILWSDFAGTTAKGRQLSGLVATGMRAVTVASKLNLFEGLLRPGDRVDVLLTVSEETGPETYTLLQNVLVLSVGGDLGGSDLGGSDAERRRDDGTVNRGGRVIPGGAVIPAGAVNPGGSVNLSVEMEDAHTLTRAEQKGRLRLVLRNPADAELLPATPLPESHPRSPKTSRPIRKEIEHVR